MVTVDVALHSATPSRAFLMHTARSPDLLFPVNAAPGSRPAPGTVRQYIGPLDSNVFHQRGAGSGLLDVRWDVFDRPTRIREAYNAGPMVPGPWFVPEKVYPLLPPHLPLFKVGWCGICRQKDTLWTNFSGSRGARYSNGFFVASHVYGPDGTEIPPGHDRVELPPEPATYRVTGQTVDTAVEWTFRSAGTTTTPTARSGIMCRGSGGVIGNSTDPCVAEPVIHVRYDMADSLALNNSVPANSRPHVPADSRAHAVDRSHAGHRRDEAVGEYRRRRTLGAGDPAQGPRRRVHRHRAVPEVPGHHRCGAFPDRGMGRGGQHPEADHHAGVTLRDTWAGNPSTKAI